MEKPKKKYKILTKIQSIEFLELLRDMGMSTTRELLRLTKEEGKYYKRKFHAQNTDSINRAIMGLESQITGLPDYYPFRDYNQQEVCDHLDFTIFLKCKCTKVISEKDIDELIAILIKKKKSLPKMIKVFDLTNETNA